MNNNKKATKRALLTSVMALVMCVVMLVGTTFAWFTDTASTGVNKIQAGNLKMEVTYKNTVGGNFGKVNKETPVFNNSALWEPGHVEFAVLNVKNIGTLALKYKLGINIANEVGSTNVDGNAFMLSDYIRFAVLDGDQSSLGRDGLVAAAGNGAALNAGYTAENHLMATGTDNSQKVVTLVVWMPETVGNEANHAVNADAPVISLGINAFATQYTYESDSFDDQYDKDAPYETVKVSNEKELRTALYNAPTDGTGVKIVMQGDITLDMYYSALLFAHSNTADKWQHSGGLSAEDAAIEAAKPENNEVPDYSTAYDTLAHYKTAVNGWDTVSSDLAEQAKFGANFPMRATNPVARLVVKPGQDVIIDLNGHNLTKNDNATHGDWSDVCTSLIGNYGTLSIINSEGTGLITGSGLESCSGGVIHNYGGALTIKGVNIDGGADYTNAKTGQYTIVNGDQSKPTLYKNGTIVLDGAHIYDGATSASLICNNAGTMTIKNETELKHTNTKVINCKGGEVFVESAKIWSDVYAIYAKGGTVTVDSAVVINGTGTMTAEGGTIIHK